MAASRAGWHGFAVAAILMAEVACVGHVTNVGSEVNTTGGTTAGGLAPGSPCTSDAACASGICGVGGFGNCCSSACSTADAICGATACDAAGACSYPVSTTTCGSCSNGELILGTCDGLGICGGGGTAKPCSGNLACVSDGTACNTACLLATGCQSGFYCASGLCVAKAGLGACSENDECQSGICGLSGVGHCCTTTCSNTALPCGATDCDGATGACAFPGSAVACGPDSGCAGDIQTKPGACDGTGNCSPNTTDCSPYACGPEDCLSTCSTSAQCATGFFCDVANAVCCSGLVSGGTLRANTDDGSDSVACCGVGTNQACQTLTQAMKLIDSAQARDVTIAAAGTAGPVSWSRDKETYPIVLGWGIELSAPGVSFDGPQGMNYSHIFVVAQYSAQDTVGYASIAGSATSPVSIGLGTEEYPMSTIEVATGSSLYLANAQVGDLGPKSTALSVLDGATLVLGQDQPAAISGTVTIGTNQQATIGWLGISCEGCSIRDAPLKGQSSVVIRGQAFADIQAGDDSTISLTSAPVIGATPIAATFNVCPSKLDGFASVEEGLGVRISAVLLEGSANMTYDNGRIQCISGGGFDLSASPSGTPTLDLTNTVIQNTELAIFASAGSATLSDSTVQFNVDGVEQSTDGTHFGTINLGGADGGVNTVVCSSNVESIYGAGGLPGVSVLNTTSAVLNASHVAWDTPGPDVFGCDSTLSSCSCQTSGCAAPAGADGMDAVNESSGSITTTDNSLSTVSCASQCSYACSGLGCCGVPGALYCDFSGQPCVR